MIAWFHDAVGQNRDRAAGCIAKAQVNIARLTKLEPDCGLAIARIRECAEEPGLADKGLRHLGNAEWQDAEWIVGFVILPTRAISDSNDPARVERRETPCRPRQGVSLE